MCSSDLGLVAQRRQHGARRRQEMVLPGGRGELAQTRTEDEVVLRIAGDEAVVLQRNAQSRTSAAAQRQSWRYATPKAGLIWRPRADLRLFANLSRSHEAPIFIDLVTGSVAANNPARAATALARLGMQRATGSTRPWSCSPSTSCPTPTPRTVKSWPPRS